MNDDVLLPNIERIVSSCSRCDVSDQTFVRIEALVLASCNPTWLNLALKSRLVSTEVLQRQLIEASRKHEVERCRFLLVAPIDNLSVREALWAAVCSSGTFHLGGRALNRAVVTCELLCESGASIDELPDPKQRADLWWFMPQVPSKVREVLVRWRKER